MKELNFMYRYFVIFVLCAVALGQSRGTFTANLPYSWNGLDRTYSLYQPPAPPTAIVAMLHPTSTELPPPFDRGPLTAMALKYSLLVLWPTSTYVAHSWYWESYTLDQFFPLAPDDGGYVCSLVSYYNAEQLPVYLMGMSSGGFMAHRVANECSGITGFGAASAQLYALAEDTVLSIPPNVGTPAGILLNGDLDITVPYCGNTRYVNWNRTMATGVDTSFSYWAATQGLTESTALCSGGQPTAVTQEQAGSILFVREVGMGHTWVPGTEEVMYNYFVSVASSLYTEGKSNGTIFSRRLGYIGSAR
jgi:poly(3-hydroxybutyrate) depolymerase